MVLKGPSQFDLEAGKFLLDRFEILRSLRQNGMCRTYEVKDSKREGRHELQVFFAALFETQEQSKEFARQMRSWSEVDSPAVASVEEVIRCDDGALLVETEWTSGSSLRDWIKQNGRMEVAQVRQLGLRLLEGLMAIHARELVHGDIKPFTIHLADGDEAIIVDGGITPGLWSAKHLGDRTMLIGTPVYAPVEQFGGESPDVQSDLYNLATVIYELTCGVVPWPGTNFLEVFQAKMSDPPTMKRRAPGVEVSTAFEQAVMRGLHPDRRERYRSASDFLDALAAT